MGFRFRKSFGRGPFRVTVSKSGISTSVGVRGARITKGPRGTHATVGLPGSGVSYTERIDAPATDQSRQPPVQVRGNGLGFVVAMLVGLFALFVVIVLVVNT